MPAQPVQPGRPPQPASWAQRPGLPPPGYLGPPPGYPGSPQRPLAAPPTETVAGYPSTETVAGYPSQTAQPTADYPAQPAAGYPFQPTQPALPPRGAPAGPAVAPPGPPRQPPRRHDGNRSRASRAWWILLPLLAAVAVAAVLLSHPFRQSAGPAAASAGNSPSVSAAAGAGSGAAASASPGTSNGPTASPTPPAVTERQAATSVAAMLKESRSDRAAISQAANDVASCGPGLSGDAKVFSDAASSRKALLTRLAATPGRAALPAALVSDLTQAWQASVSADQGYARWAADEVSRGCTPNDTADPGYQATVAPNAAATKDKTAFTSQWNPVAVRYGLTQYQQSDL